MDLNTCMSWTFIHTWLLSRSHVLAGVQLMFHIIVCAALDDDDALKCLFEFQSFACFDSWLATSFVRFGTLCTAVVQTLTCSQL